MGFFKVWKASFWRRLLGLGDVDGKKYKTKDGKDPANAAQIRSPKTKSEMSFRDDPAAAEKALASCNYILGVNALVHALQAERGASGIFVASGGTRLGDLLETLIGHVDKAWSEIKLLSVSFQSMSDSFQAVPELDISQFQEMRADIKSCAVNHHQVHDSYVQSIDSLLSTTTQAVEVLEKTPVGDVLCKYLMLVYLKEHIGRFRSLVGGITSSDTIKLSVEDYTAIVAILASTKAFAKCFILNAPTAQMRKDARSDANAQEVMEIMAAVLESREAAEVALAKMSPVTWYKLMSVRMDVLNNMQNELANTMQATVQEYCQDANMTLEAPELSYAFSMTVEKAFSIEVEGVLQKEWRIPMQQLSIVEEVGRGGTGSVYRGTWEGQEVCVKIMSEQAILGGDYTLMKDFGREISVLCKIRHPNIVSFLGVAISPPKFCMVLEYIGGGTLYRAIRNQPESIQFFKFAIQLARGMKYIHETAKLIHRDLKTLNILVSDTGQLKVCDFGMTLTDDPRANMTAAVGTLRWMAPEVMLGSAYSYPCDVYSMGVIFWELLTKDLPWRYLHTPGQNSIAPLGIYKAMEDKMRPAFPTGTPAAIESIISQCWHPTPSKRLTSSQILERLEKAEAEATEEDIAFLNSIHREGSDGAPVVKFKEL